MDMEMHKYHKTAEKLVELIIADLKKFLPQDGEDISLYNPSSVDASIQDLIRVRTLLACANEATGRNT